MTANPISKKLAKEPVFDRSNWTPAEHCAHANRQLIEKGINEARRRQGLFPVKWVVREGRVMIAEGEPKEARQIQHVEDK